MDVKRFLTSNWPVVLIGLFVLIGGGVAVAKITRGVRNNNPGNIRKGEKWQGLAPSQTDADFAQFISSYWGIRALAKTLKTYQSKHGLTTIAGIVARWAPPNENDTGAYIASVAKRTGLDKDAPVDFNNPLTLAAVTRAIIHHENGFNPYQDTEVLSAVRGA